MTIKNIQSLESILVRKYLTAQLSVSSEIHQLFIINGENVFFFSIVPLTEEKIEI